jgi:hypothetical protein
VAREFHTAAAEYADLVTRYPIDASPRLAFTWRTVDNPTVRSERAAFASSRPCAYAWSVGGLVQ